MKPCVVCGVDVKPSIYAYVNRNDTEVFCTEHEKFKPMFESLDIQEKRMEDVLKSFKIERQRIRKLVCTFEFNNKPIEKYSKKKPTASMNSLIDTENFIWRKYDWGSGSDVNMDILKKELEAKFDNPKISKKTMNSLESWNHHSLSTAIEELGWNVKLDNE